MEKESATSLPTKHRKAQVFPVKLADTVVRNAKVDPKTYRLSDGRGLYLVVPTRGNKWWMFRYRFAGKENSISFGIYPDVSLKYAREQREEARELRAKGINPSEQGINPSEQRKVDKLQKAEGRQNTFENLVEVWFNTRKKEWSESHQKKISGIRKNPNFGIGIFSKLHDIRGNFASPMQPFRGFCGYPHEDYGS